MLNSESQCFYVYLYLRDDGTPYYVGKGKGRRAWVKSGRTVRPPVNNTKILIVRDGLTEIEAFELEKSLIAEHGRLDEGTGILRNGTAGGEGTAGHLKPPGWGENHSKTMKKMIASGKVKTFGENVKGKKQSKERVEHRVKAHLGAKRLPSTCEKIRKKAIGRTQSTETVAQRILYVECEHCHEKIDKGNYTRWHGNMCKHFTGKTHESVTPKDEQQYVFIHSNGEQFIGTRHEFITAKNFKRTTVSSLIHRGVTRLGWRLLN